MVELGGGKRKVRGPFEAMIKQTLDQQDFAPISEIGPGVSGKETLFV